MNTPELILASSSPRRHDLLRHLGLPFTIDPSTIDETAVQAPTPALLAELLARSKALDVARRYADAVVIGADTLVEFEGQILNKPRDAEDAERMLALLAGQTHQVHSGIAVATRRAGGDAPELSCLSSHVTATVRMRALTPDEIRAYVATGEPLDKAGAYAAQERGAAFIEQVDGSYLAVVGLPLVALRDLLLQAGVRSPAPLDELETLERGERG